MEVLVWLLMFILGTVFWSFGSVLIRRTSQSISKETIKSILYWRSECPQCFKKLGAKELVPVFSYLIQKGKCSVCGSKISSFYLWLEIFSWIAFVLSYIVMFLLGVEIFSLDFWMNLVFLTFVNWLLVLFVFYDLLFYEVNVYFWLTAIIWSIFWQFLWLTGDFEAAFLGGVAFFAWFMFIYIFGKYYVKFRFGEEDWEWIWGWDVMLAFLVGLLAFFMLQDAEIVNIIYLFLVYMFLSSILWLIFYGLSYFFYEWQQWRSIPFVPAMVVAYFILLFFADYFVSMFL